MSLTLGEKLQQAREARGITISEVAEQTRISPIYLDCIENNDYRTLPGGIFNKGFIKSFAKYVGIDEQEALHDYANLIAGQDNQTVNEPKTYRPQVLTDDRANVSRFPTIVFAAVILGLITLGALWAVNYFQPKQNQFAGSNTNANSGNTNTAPETNASNSNVAVSQTTLALDKAKIEFKPAAQEIWITSLSDGKKASLVVKPEKPQIFEPKQNLKISYAKEQAQNARLLINGKEIKLPTVSQGAKRNIIEFEITKENFGQIWQNGAIASVNAAPSNAPLSTAPR